MTSKSTHALDWIDDELSALERGGLRRRLTAHAGPQGAISTIGGRPCVNFGSNDYLGLAADPRVMAAAAAAIEREGWGSAASPLLAGRGAAHQQLETQLAEFEGTEAAIVFSSGFAANCGALTALAARGDVIFADEMNHASLIDGGRLSRAEIRVYSHADVTQLAGMLADSKTARRKLIVTDSLFSMDGDIAPLADLVELARLHAAILVVDEAHATGVFGAGGRGVAEHLGVESEIDVRIGTLSKALGGIGGFVCGRRSLIDWLINRARPYVFSTAPPAAACAAASAALETIRSAPARGAILLEQAAQLRATLIAQGWDVGASTSQIIPVILGEPNRTVEMAARLAERGLYVPPIRPPSVPAGLSRLRIGLSAAHTPEMIGQLTTAMAELAAG